MNKITKEQALEQLKHIRSLGARYGINLTTNANNIERYINQPNNAQVEEVLEEIHLLNVKNAIRYSLNECFNDLEKKEMLDYIYRLESSVKQALSNTPSTPTEEDVCKAILEEDKSFTEVEYIFNNDNGEMDFLIHEGIWNFWLSDYLSDDTITIDFKGSTITIIGQFYESVVNK